MRDQGELGELDESKIRELDMKPCRAAREGS